MDYTRIGQTSNDGIVNNLVNYNNNIVRHYNNRVNYYNLV
jgi:hypothetical protein